MNKTIVEIIIPALGNSYEVLIPPTTQLFKVLELIKKAVGEMSDGRYKPSKDTTLCDSESGGIINLEMTADQLGIKNGFKLLLM